MGCENMVSGPIASRTVAPYLFEGTIQAIPRSFIDMFVSRDEM